MIGTAARCGDGQVSGVVADELSSDPVERRRYDTQAAFGTGGKQLHVTVRRVKVEAAAFPAAIRERCILAVSVPVGDAYAESLLKPRLLTRRESLGSCDDTPDRKATEQALANQVDEREQRARIHVQEERRQRTDPLSQSAKLLFGGGVGRDDPRILEAVESYEATMKVATVDDPQIVRRVSNLGPDIKEVGALLLPPRERVGLEAERLS